MLRVGLTGGIASGKTTVAGMLTSLGCYVLSTDRIARDVVQPGSAGWQRVRHAFGPGMFTAAGELDRGALGELVFADPGARQQLELLLHPLIMQRVWQRLCVLQQQKTVPIAVVEVPLLFECALQDRFDCSLLVWTSRGRQQQWLQARSNLSAAAAQQRLAAQMPLDQKRMRADLVIENSADYSALSIAVVQAWKRLWCRSYG